MATFCNAKRMGVSDASIAAIESALVDAANTPGVNLNAFAQSLDYHLCNGPLNDPADASGLRISDEVVTAKLAFVAGLHGVTLN